MSECFNKIPVIKSSGTRGLFHDSRGDIRSLSKVINMLIDEVVKCQKRIVELEKRD